MSRERNHFGEWRKPTHDPRPTAGHIRAELAEYWKRQGPCPGNVEAMKANAVLAEQVAEIERDYLVTTEPGVMVFTGPNGDIVRVRGYYGAGIWPLLQPLLIVQADEYEGMRLCKRAFEDAARRRVERNRAALDLASQSWEGGAA